MNKEQIQFAPSNERQAGSALADRESGSLEREQGKRAEAVESYEDQEFVALLQAAEDIINTPPPRDPAEIDAKAAEYEALERRLKKLPGVNESRLERLEKIEKKWIAHIQTRKARKELPADEYEELQKNREGAGLLAALEKVETTIKKMEAQNRDDSGFATVVEQLKGKRDELYQKVDETVFEKARNDFDTRLAEIKNKAETHYHRRAEELEQAIQELKNDPEVMRRHGERIKEREEKARQEYIAALIDKLTEAAAMAQSLLARQNRALQRIQEVAGAVEEGTSKEIRGKLINAVLIGEGAKQLKNVDEVAPWKTHTSNWRYVPTLNQLRRMGFTTIPGVGTASEFDELALPSDEDKKAGVTAEISEKAKKILEHIRLIEENDARLQDILGREWETVRDRRRGKEYKQPGEFFAAFGIREKNDREGKTRTIRQSVNEASARRQEKEAGEARRRKAIAAELENLRTNGGNTVLVETQNGGVLLGVRKSKKKNIYFEVLQVAGEAKEQIKKGSAFASFRNMPEWLARAIDLSATAKSQLVEIAETVRKS